MTIRPSSLQFDIAFSALAAISYIKKWDSKLWIGLQGFSLATLNVKHPAYPAAEGDPAYPVLLKCYKCMRRTRYVGSPSAA